MTLLADLINELTRIQNYNTELSSLLEKAGALQELIEVMVIEHNKSYDFLQNLSKQALTEDELALALRLFLKKRITLLHYSDADYISFPHSPMNQLCHKLAQALAKPNEPLISILIPTLKYYDYPIISEDLRSLTEIKKEGRREIAWGSFLVSEHGKNIIPILPWFECQAENSGEFFNHLCTENDALIPLSEPEIHMLRRIASNESYDFFQEFILRKKLMNMKGTLSEALMKLCAALMENGKGGTGNPGQANDAVLDDIRAFAQVLSMLSDQQRNTIFNLMAREQTFSYYWNIIAGYDPVNRDPHATTCVEENAKYFREILSEHPEAFSGIQVGNRASEDFPLSSITPYARILKRIEANLKERQTALSDYYQTGQLESGVRAIKLLQPGQASFIKEKIDAYVHHLSLPVHNRLPDSFIRSIGDAVYVLQHFNSHDISMILTPQQHLDSVLLSAITNRSELVLPLLRHRLMTFPDNALHMAIIQNNENDVKLFIEQNKPLNVGAHTIMGSPLKLAVMLENIPLVAMLVKAGADCTETHYHKDLKKNMPLLSYAYVKNGWLMVFNALLDRSDYFIDSFDDSLWTCLHYAVQHDNLQISESLLKKGANANARTKECTYPIHLAIENDSVKLIHQLANYGADLNVLNGHSASPLLIAHRRQQFRSVIALIHAGANFQDSGVLESAQVFHQFDVMAACLDRMPDLSLINKNLREKILLDFLAHVANPRLYEKWANRLVLVGTIIPNLTEFYKNNLVKMKLADLIACPHLPRLKALHGFEMLCIICKVEIKSEASLRLFAACIEKLLLSRQDPQAAEITAALADPSLHSLCRIAHHNIPSRFVSYIVFSSLLNPWSEMPEPLKQFVAEQVIPPESAPSRKRNYDQYV